MQTLTTTEEEVLASLDFDVEECEDLYAPGFWRGFKDGIMIGAAITGAVGVGILIT